MCSYAALLVQFNQESLSLERYLPNFGPRKGVQPGDTLEHTDAHVCDSQIEWDAFYVFGRVHFHAIQLASAGRLQQIQIGLGGCLAAALTATTIDAH